MSCFVSVDLSGAKEDEISDENRLQFVPAKIRYGQQCNFYYLMTTELLNQMENHEKLPFSLPKVQTICVPSDHT